MKLCFKIGKILQPWMSPDVHSVYCRRNNVFIEPISSCSRSPCRVRTSGAASLKRSANSARTRRRRRTWQPSALLPDPALRFYGSVQQGWRVSPSDLNSSFPFTSPKHFHLNPWQRWGRTWTSTIFKNVVVVVSRDVFLERRRDHQNRNVRQRTHASTPFSELFLTSCLCFILRCSFMLIELI